MSKKHVLDRHHIPDRATCLKRYLVAGVALLVSLLLADDVHDMVIGLGADHGGIRTTGRKFESYCRSTAGMSRLRVRGCSSTPGLA